MNNSDEVVDRLLAGLRDAEPPAGMETRILHTMESSAPARSHWLLYAAVTACMSLAAAWSIATMKVPQTPAMPMYSPPLSAAGLPSAQIATSPKIHRANPVKRVPSDATQLASFPAPPLPLTDQEKLLIRVAHQRDASKVAALNPEVHAAQIAQANQQFQKFFEVEDEEMRRESE